MEKPELYLEQNRERFLSELFELLRIPSISSQEQHKDHMMDAAGYWKKILMEAGADQVTIFPTPGHPVVYGEKIIHPDKKTVLVYGHMDVMPVDPIEKWDSDPFEPEIR